MHIVTGAGPDERRAWIRRLLAARPAWAALTPRACPCCLGRVETQVLLARLLRERRPKHVLLELGDVQHLTPLQRVLEESPLAQYVQVGRGVRLPEDAQLPAESLGA